MDAVKALRRISQVLADSNQRILNPTFQMPVSLKPDEVYNERIVLWERFIHASWSLFFSIDLWLEIDLKVKWVCSPSMRIK